MKITIDVSQVVYQTGVSRYTANLVENILLLDKENHYLLLGMSLRRLEDIKRFVGDLQGDSLQTRYYPIAPTIADVIWNRLHVLPIETLVGKIDVFHSSDWTQPPSKAFKVTTIHDLSPLLLPEFTDPKIVSVHRRRLAWVKKEVDRIIVPSHAMEEDLVKEGYKADEIRVIYEAVDPLFSPKSKLEVERLKRKSGIGGRYLLGVGVNKRKNTERIISAFQSLDNKGLRLVLVGNRYSDMKDVDGVIFTGHIKDEDLPILYSGAEALVYPSLYEGFGLPILEAFACKVPVVTSNVGSMSEVAHDAAVLVDPYKVESIAGGIKKALENKEALIKKGKARVKKFSWEKTAKETLKVYKEALSNL